MIDLTEIEHYFDQKPTRLALAVLVLSILATFLSPALAIGIPLVFLGYLYQKSERTKHRRALISDGYELAAEFNRSKVVLGSNQNWVEFQKDDQRYYAVARHLPQSYKRKMMDVVTVEDGVVSVNLDKSCNSATHSEFIDHLHNLSAQWDIN